MADLLAVQIIFCQTIQLLKAIERYDPDKSNGARFETFLVWFFKSQVRWKKLFHLRRLNLEFTCSEQTLLQKENVIFENEQNILENQIEEKDIKETNSEELPEIILHSDWQNFNYFKKQMRELFAV